MSSRETSDWEDDRIEATSADFKALAHPLRLRMIRLCLHESRTNKQLADHLELDPATSLHHMRTLVGAGFLEPEAARTGASGALEKPYRATTKSWRLAIPDPGNQLSAVIASIDALRAELHQAGSSALLTSSRVGLQLSADEARELTGRLRDLAEEYVKRPPSPDGKRVGLFLILHDLADVAGDE
jgi:predicted ArsR family transcriptional regulator